MSVASTPPREVPTDEGPPLARLRRILRTVEGSGERALSEADVLELPKLYRFAASELARLQTFGSGAGAAQERVSALLSRAHAVLHGGLERSQRGVVERAREFLLAEVPRAVRAEWKVVVLSFALLYGFALVAFVAVRNDLDLAWSLTSPELVSQEIGQLEAIGPGESFRGNFTFGLGDSPQTAGWIMTHNMGAGIVAFGAGLVPPLFLLFLGFNGMMVGTYTAVAAHWGQALAISSILWCHGVIELQAIVLAGAAGLVLVRAWIAPGPWSRRHAMSLESRRAWRLLAPVFPMLFVAGMIEGFVSPHAPTWVRVAVAVGSAVAIAVWLTLGGRSPRAASSAATGGAQNA